MTKSLVISAFLLFALFAIHYRAAWYDLRRMRVAWTARPASLAMLVMRWSFVLLALSLLLMPLGVPALPALAAALVVSMVHVGAITYIYS
jgi:hypothetical protein